MPNDVLDLGQQKLGNALLPLWSQAITLINIDLFQLDPQQSF